MKKIAEGLQSSVKHMNGTGIVRPHTKGNSIMNGAVLDRNESCLQHIDCSWKQDLWGL